MNVRWTISLAACTAVLLCGALRAIATEPNIGQKRSAMQGSAGIIRFSTLMGTTILDPQGQKLGQIKDVLFDSQASDATFVVLDAEAPGSGHAMLVVPFRALWVSFNPLDHRQSVVLDLRPDQLRAAPQIQNDEWQVFQNPQFLEKACNFYQIRTYTAARPIDTPSVPRMPSSPAPCPVPQPCVNSGDPAWAGWSEQMIEFSSE
ncbi:MAG: PRC-barrel domain-containing protein [Thermoguttaceae bacterium]